MTALLDEKQIYRVDHYVAKGLTQLLPSLSSTNSLFAHVWDGKSIESVSVIFHEKIDIEGRGQFYDRYGAIKDVMQNHVLQLLAFFALDTTAAKTDKERAEQRAAFLQSLSIKKVVRGQYEGYRAEKEVSPHSTTETYAVVTLVSNHPRWKGVTFLLEAGKALPEKRTQLCIRFKSDKNFPPNQLVVQFSPKEGILLHINGLREQTIELRSGEFHYTEAYEAVFERRFFTAIEIFVSFQEIEAQWRLTDAIVAYVTNILFYQKTSSLICKNHYRFLKY